MSLAGASASQRSPAAAPRPARDQDEESAAGQVHEYGYTRRDFDRVCVLIRERAGIVLGEGKQDMVYSRLARRVRALELSSIGEYLKLLERRDDAEEWQAFVNALTTNLTSFFREAHHFDIFKRFLARRRSRVRIWCAAASTGEEPYSIAISAAEHAGNLRPDVEIVATDIDTQVLETASAGIYPIERVERLPREQLRAYFQRGGGSREGYVRVRQDLRQLIDFQPLNLLDSRWPVQGPFDVIFCRNVMIYFDKPTQYRILKRFTQLLKPDGLLFAGHSESFFHAADLFRPCGRTVYQRADAAPPPRTT